MRSIITLTLLIGSLAHAQFHVRMTLGTNFPLQSTIARLQVVAGIGDVDGDGLPDLVAGDIATAPGATGVVVISGRNGVPLRFITLSPNWSSRIQCIVGLSDVDGDAVPDFAIGMPYEFVVGMSTVGRVQIFSGATGAVLRTMNGAAIDDRFGFALSAIGDLDADGVGDVVVGAPQGGPENFGTYPGIGYVQVMSGATGAPILTITNPSSTTTTVGYMDFFGRSVARLGDVDGDGKEDFAVGAPEQMEFTDNTGVVPNTGGYVRVHSGASGAVLYQVGGSTLIPGVFGGFGYVVSTVGDVNLDGFEDFVATSPAAAATVAGSPFAHVLSGLNGAPISTLIAPPSTSFWWLDSTAAGAGDVNGDGIPDVIVGMKHTTVAITFEGRAALYSATGPLLATIDGTGAQNRLATSVAGLGDQNGDGFAEVGIVTLFEAGFQQGSLRIAGLAVADPYLASQPVPLWLGWNHIAGSSGAVSLGGAPAAAAGVLVASTARASAIVGGIPIVVDLSPGAFSAMAIAFPASGVYSLGLNLRQPGLAGIAVNLQGAAFDPTGAPLVSNGLTLAFAP